MLALSTTATEAIEGILAAQDVPSEAGLRISPMPSPDGNEASSGSLGLSIAEGPGSSDEVIQLSSARVFLEPNVVDFLDDKLLDAQTDGQNVQFVIVAQGAGPGGAGPGEAPGV